MTQKGFLRRVLHLGAQSEPHILFTETGVVPIQHRRLQLSLRFLLFLFRPAPPLLVQGAIHNPVNLALYNKPGYISDLIVALATLPIPVRASPRDLAIEPSIPRILTAVGASFKTELHTTVRNSSKHGTSVIVPTL